MEKREVPKPEAKEGVEGVPKAGVEEGVPKGVAVVVVEVGVPKGLGFKDGVPKGDEA